MSLLTGLAPVSACVFHTPFKDGAFTRRSASPLRNRVLIVNVKRNLTLHIMFFGCRASGEKNDLYQLL
jgi:hypothetical protein